jgi:acetyl-CoA carboxylase carboxyltransferase component
MVGYAGVAHIGRMERFRRVRPYAPREPPYSDPEDSHMATDTGPATGGAPIIDVYIAARNGMIDDVIDPRETRP